MTEPTDLAKKYTGLGARKSENRTKYVKRFLLTVLALGFAILIVYAGTSYGLGILTVVGILALFVTALVFGLYGVLTLVPAIVFPLDPLDKAFEKVYKALGFLESSPNDPLIQRQVYRLLGSAYYQLESGGAGDALLKEADDLRQKTFDNIESRVLPAADLDKTPEELKTVVETLAGVLADPSLEGLKRLNSKIEEKLKPGEVTSAEISIRSAAKKFHQSTAGRVVESFIVGPILTLIFVLLYAISTQQDFNMFLKNHPEIVLIGGITAAVGLLVIPKAGKQ